MNDRTLKVALIREGVALKNTMMLSFDSVREELEPLYESDAAKFLHIANKRTLTLQEFEDDYAEIFNFHGLNVIALDSKGKTQLLNKVDGTVQTSEGISSG